jgi:hypothetical protein
MEQSVVDGLKAKHGPNLVLVEVGNNSFIVKGPSREQYAVFRGMIFDETKRSFATEDLVRACVVFPEYSKFDALMQQYPALSEVLAEHVLTLAKGSEQVRAKKL